MPSFAHTVKCVLLACMIGMMMPMAAIAAPVATPAVTSCAGSCYGYSGQAWETCNLTVTAPGLPYSLAAGVNAPANDTVGQVNSDMCAALSPQFSKVYSSYALPSNNCTLSGYAYIAGGNKTTINLTCYSDGKGGLSAIPSKATPVPPAAACNNGMTAQNGVCACPKGEVLMGNQCAVVPTCTGGGVLDVPSNSCICPGSASTGQVYQNGACLYPGACQLGQSRVNGQCVATAICKSGQELHQDTNTCSCLPGLIAQANGTCACPSGQALLITDVCAPIPTCTGGQIVNPATNSCVCPNGQPMNNGQCEQLVTCTGGGVLNPTLNICQCPNYGGVYQNGQCVYTPVTCIGGIINTANNTCQCPPGTTYQSGTCVAPPPSCIGGTVVNNACTCTSGQYVSNGRCMAATIQPAITSISANCVESSGNLGATIFNCSDSFGDDISSVSGNLTPYPTLLPVKENFSVQGPANAITATNICSNVNQTFQRIIQSAKLQYSGATIKPWIAGSTAGALPFTIPVTDQTGKGTGTVTCAMGNGTNSISYSASQLSPPVTPTPVTPTPPAPAAPNLKTVTNYTASCNIGFGGESCALSVYTPSGMTNIVAPVAAPFGEPFTTFGKAVCSALSTGVSTNASVAPVGFKNSGLNLNGKVSSISVTGTVMEVTVGGRLAIDYNFTSNPIVCVSDGNGGLMIQ